jgi:phosphoribosylaminoimidazole carboxylase (NCAIR synthetase)
MSLGWSRSRDAAVERRGWSALGRGQATLDRIVTTGYDGRGKRVVRKAAGRTKTEAKTKLRDLLHDRD